MIKPCHGSTALLCMYCRAKYVVSGQIFVNISNVKFHENLSSWRYADTRGQRDRRTDMAKIIGVFRLHTNAPNEVI